MLDHKQQLQDVNDILTQRVGYIPRNMCIAGGAARDLAHGYAPNDIDIVCVRMTPEDINELVDDLATIGYAVIAWSDNRSPSNAAAGSHYTGHDLQRWTDVVQLSCVQYHVYNKPRQRLDIDILVSPLGTVQEAIQANDFNLNHYALMPDGHPDYLGLVPEGTLVQTRDSSITPERIERMRNLAKQYGWAVE